MKIVVIGGGIAGLAAAHYIEKKSKEENQKIEITVIESADYWGGKIKTIVENGFVIEGGPDAYLVTKPWMRTLCKELGLDEELHGTSQEHTETFILHKGQLTSIPTGLTMTIPTEFSPLVKTKLMTIPEKARMSLDFLIPTKKDNEDESLAGFITRRLGRAAYDNLVGPLLSGIYAGDGDRLSLRSTFPMLRDMEIEHGGLIKGAIALKLKRAAIAKQHKNGKNAGKSRSIFETHKRGLKTIVDELVTSLEDRGVELLLNFTAKKVHKTEHGLKIQLENKEDIFANAIVLAAPAYVTASLIADLSPELASELVQIEYVTTATISLAYPQKDLPARKEPGVHRNGLLL